MAPRILLHDGVYHCGLLAIEILREAGPHAEPAAILERVHAIISEEFPQEVILSCFA